MLVLCQDCSRQFDVSGLSPGQQLRCLCGHTITIEEQKVHEARSLHCSGCGGTLDEKATSCGYCGGSISADERQLGQACPQCYARLNKGASFCRECGVKIAPQAIKTTPIDANCPRCSNDLVLCEVADGQFTECAGCGGIWLDTDTFDNVVQKRDYGAISTAIAQAAAGTDNELETQLVTDTVKYLPCPNCKELMNRKNFAGCSGVIVDWCRDHGIWFDTHELEKIINFVEAGGMDKARARDIDSAKKRAARANDQARRARNSAAASTAVRFDTEVRSDVLADALVFVGSALKNLFVR